MSLPKNPPLNVLIVSSAEKGAETISGLLDRGNYESAVTVHSGSEARRSMISCGYDVVIINSPLADEFGHELAMDLAQGTASGVMLLVKADTFDEICFKVVPHGVLVVAKPLSRPIFRQAFKLAEAVHNRLRTFERENRKLQTKIEEIKMVDRAKWVLVEHLSMDEASAHRYIEKQAMDMRLTKFSIAESILKTYES